MTELGAGQVTVADLFRELSAIKTLIAELVTDMRVAQAEQGVARDVRNDHEKRIRALERGWWKLAGGTAAVSTLISVIIALLALRYR